MKLTITGRHQSFSDRMKTYVTEKAQRLDRFHSGIQKADVILNVEGQRHIAEMIVSIRHGGQLVAKETGADMYSAIDLLIDKVERLLKKQKERISSRRTKSGRLVVPTSVMNQSSDDEEEF